MEREDAAGNAVLVTFAGEAGTASLAHATLARAFGLGVEVAERVLAQGGAIVAPLVAPQASSLALLRLLGVQTQPLRATGARYDLSVRLNGVSEAARARVAAFCPGADLTALEGPSGLVLSDLAAETARAAAIALQRRPGVKVTLAPQAGALYDIFAPKGFEVPAALRTYLAILGPGADAHVVALGDALVPGIEAGIVARILARFPDLGLVAVNRAFQRYDLAVTGEGALSLREAADFLAARGLGEAGTALESGAPVTVERGLTRTAARQFLNDYRHIGLNAQVSLCWGRAQNG